MQRLFELSAAHCVHRDLYQVAKGGHNDTWEAEGLEYYLVSDEAVRSASKGWLWR